jgi:hypothetical protein
VLRHLRVRIGVEQLLVGVVRLFTVRQREEHGVLGGGVRDGGIAVIVVGDRRRYDWGLVGGCAVRLVLGGDRFRGGVFWGGR